MEDKDGIWKTCEDVLIRNRILFSIVLFGALLLEGRKTKFIVHDITDLSNPASLSALLLINCGLFLRSWAAGVIRKTKRLAIEGPYSLTRHPLYLGSLLLGFGFAFVVSNNKNLLLVLAVAALLYIPKIRREEKHLAGQFPEEWQMYRERTGLLFPKKWPHLRAEWSWSQWMHNREYNALLTTLAVVAVIAGWSIFQRSAA